MTPNQRIFLNIVATYGRSLYAVALGLFTSRWLLASLGQVDYGLYGVVGGLTGFIVFFNGLLSGAISRFFAINVGKSHVSGREVEGLEECRKWFNTAVCVHTVVPLAVIIVGYPLGEWAIRHWLTIPPGRIESSVWVFRFVCVSCFVGMVNVPFQSMYGAKQYIAELTIYSFVSSTVNFLFLGYMVTHPGDWLSRYALGAMLIAVIPQLIICVRAIQVFPECRFNRAYLWDWQRTKELSIFAFWQFFASLGGLARAQGLTVLVNKLFGPALNASMSIANNVAGQAGSLSAALQGAFSPAVFNKEGAGERNKMLMMAYRSSKFGTVLCLMFVIPLMIEMEFVLQVWLKTPPPSLAAACRITLVMLVANQTLRGLDLAVFANGKIGLYNSAIGIFYVTSIPVTWAIVSLFHTGFLTVFYVLLAYKILVAFIAFPIARRMIDYSFRYWAINTCLPIALVTIVSMAASLGVQFLLDQSAWLRLVAVTVASECVFLPLVFFVVLDAFERNYFKQKISTLLRRVL